MVKQNTVLRIARPTSRLKHTGRMYCKGLGLKVLAEFKDHEGFDGVIIGNESQSYNIEFTKNNFDLNIAKPSKDDLWIFYIDKKKEWKKTCTDMLNSGFKEVESLNPYWDNNGKTFEDPDGFRIVIQNADWKQ